MLNMPGSMCAMELPARCSVRSCARLPRAPGTRLSWLEERSRWAREVSGASEAGDSDSSPLEVSPS